MPSVIIYAISGPTLYLKPSTNGNPTTTSPWGGDIVNGTWNSSLEQWTFTVASNTTYLVYRQLGASPASTDTEVGDVVQAIGAGSEIPAGVVYSSLLSRVGHYLFGIRNGFSPDQIADITDCITDGLRRVYTAHDWSFLRPVADVVTTAPYTTGTITIASGVVTLTGGTFPSWAASGVLKVNDKYYSVASRGSNTQITLDTVSVTVASASSYQLACPEVSLDPAFESIDGDSDLTYYPSPSNWYPPVQQRHDSTIRKLESDNPEFNRPVFYSVRTARFDPTVGSRRVLALYPTPDQAYTLRVPMVLRPVSLDENNPYLIGGELLSQVMLEACLASAEHNFEEREHVHEKRFLEQLAIAISNDQERSTPTSLGPDSPTGVCGRRSVFDYNYRLREQRIGRLTFDGDVM